MSGPELPQPLSRPVPDRLWLLDLGSGDIVWSAERDPDGEQVDAVEYVRVERVPNDVLIEALEGFVSDCANEECERCEVARAALSLARSEGGRG